MAMGTLTPNSSSESQIMIEKAPGKLVAGAKCKVVGVTHAGKAGDVREINTSKNGHVTIMVVQKNEERCKTLATSASILQ